MARVDIHLKVELDLDPNERPEKVAGELERMLRKVYAVERVEVTNIVVQDE